MNIHAIHDLSNKSVVTLLQHSLAQVTDEKLIKNYRPDYSDTTGNLF